jgi:putative peptidoglycan lipid II flippase
MFSHKTILKKTAVVAGSTLLSRFFGIIRELLMVRYLGVSGLSDAFLTAYKIPNSLRKIFAEGALSAAFIPTVVSTVKRHDTKGVAGLMTLGFIFFEGIVLILCALIMAYAHQIIGFIAPGFSQQQICQAVPMIHILMPLLFFISSSALLAGALQATGHFFTPAITPVLVNILFIASLCVCLTLHMPINTLCWFILGGGFVQCIVHLAVYFAYNFSFGPITKKDLGLFKNIIGAFLLCLPSVSLMEIALFIDTSFASLLKPGSLSLLFYANRFVGIPLGVFAVAFSTILLPHFSRINTYSPKRLHFYLLESAQFVFWVSAPITLFMAYFSQEIFSTIFLSKGFTLAQTEEAGSILIAFVAGLFFFSLNKIILNIFYAMHAAWIPAVVALGSTTLNIILNMLFIEQFQTVGLALATTISSIFQTIIFLIVLHKKYAFRLYTASFLLFFLRYTVQLALCSILFIYSYNGIHESIVQYLPIQFSSFLINTIGFWFWVGPLAGICFILIWYSRKLFNIKLYFLS